MNSTPKWALLTSFPLRGGIRTAFAETLQRVGLDLEDAHEIALEQEYSSANPTAEEIKSYRAHVSGQLSDLSGPPILALGNVPLKVASGLSGITTKRGLQSTKMEADSQVFSTLHPSAVDRNVRYKSDWLNDLATFGALINGTTEETEVHIVSSVVGITAMEMDMQKNRGFGALDVETTIGDPFTGNCQLVSVSVCFDGKRAWVLNAEDIFFDKALAVLARGKWIMHNGSYDLMVLHALTPFRFTLVQDTMAMAYLLHPEEKKGLEILSGVMLGLPPYKGVDYKTILDEPFEKVAEMNGRDTARTYKLFRPLADELNTKPHLSRTYQWLLLPAIQALVDMTVRGVPVDRQRLEALQAELEVELEARRAKLQELAGSPDPVDYGKDDWPKGVFNPGSTQQVGHVLFHKMGLPVVKETETGAASTDAEVLDKLTEIAPSEFLTELQGYRTANKILTAFLNSWHSLLDSEDKLHPRYKPTKVVTGRLAAESPNIQQVPRDPRFRGVFGGVPGHLWIKADLSQIELRLAGWIAQENAMMEAYRNGEDLHALTARRVLGVDDPSAEWKPGRSARDLGKVLNFSLLYGAYPTKLMEIAQSQYGMTITKQEATDYRAVFFDSYPGLVQWHQDVKMKLRRTGRVESPLGRVRTFPEINDPDEWVVKRAEREAVNHPVQSFGSDILLSSLVRLPADVRQYAIAEVHDEIDFLVPTGEVERVTPIIKATMEDVSWLKKWGINLTVPVVAEVEAKEYWA